MTTADSPIPTGEVRVRIAPSPTGDPHVGTAYQALFNYAFARGRGGKLILRIEDTDQARSTRESEQAILDSLRWLGIPWDEGPDVGGPCGPYRQSERTEIYREHIDRLLADGNAYRCFCTKERLDELRATQGAATGYDRHCRDLDPAEADKRAAAGEPFVVRMKIPLEGVCDMQDLLRGHIAREWSLVDDQVIQKSDGFPTYHLANVVDDHLMGVTHVMRGEEWINSVPKHLKLYEYFGWEPPVFCHLLLLRNPDKSKLSKRKNPTSVNYYREAGYLPEALRNFIGLMGWVMPDGEEKFTLEDMVKNLKLEDISLGGPVFDVDKLRWLNARYIREDHDAAALTERLQAWAVNAEKIRAIAPLVQPRLETLADWGFLSAPFFADEVPLDPADLIMKGRDEAETMRVLQFVSWRLETQAAFTADALDPIFREIAEKLELKLRELTAPLFVALSGRKSWTPLFHSMEVLGPDMTRVRIRRAIEALGGLGNKKLKKLEKEYTATFGPRG